MTSNNRTKFATVIRDGAAPGDVTNPMWIVPRERMVAAHMDRKKCHLGTGDRHQHEASGSRRDV